MSSQAAAAPAGVSAVAASIRRWRDAVLSLRVAYVLGTLVAIQWLALLALALTVRHNGWLYYAGGDQLWHYSGAYVLAHGHLPPSFVGYGWSVLLAPVAAIAGPNIVSALPAMILFNTLILLPVALLCVYGIAARIAGRLFGYWAAALWIAIPYLGILVVEQGYHQKYTELTLPQFLGLSSVPDFPSTVALLVGAYFSVRTVETRTWTTAAAAGLATGYAIAIKPSNAIFLFAPAALFLVAARRAVIPFLAALAPILLTLALWKYRGLGQLAAAPAETMRVAGGIGGLRDRIYNPDLNTWGHLHDVLLGLREHFWAARVIEWLPLAGIVALALRGRKALLLVGVWFVAYLLTKATYLPASVDDASVFRILMPGLPAYLLLAASVVLLVPGSRPRPEPVERAPTRRQVRIALGVAAAVFVVAPAAVIAAVPPLHDQGREAIAFGPLVPVRNAIDPRAAVVGGDVRLSWNAAATGPAAVFYRIVRTSNPLAVGSCAGRLNNAADQCQSLMDPIGAARETSFVDRPGPGTWTYRIGVSANWLNDVAYGDVTVLSQPVTVTVK